MKFNILNAERTQNLMAVALTLANGTNVIVGNKIVDKLLEADGIDFSFFRAICAANGYALSFEGSMVQHKAGDNYGEGAEYRSDGYHIQSPEDSYPEIIPTANYFALKVQLPNHVQAVTLNETSSPTKKVMPNQGANAFGEDDKEEVKEEVKTEVKEEVKEEAKTPEATA